MSSVCTFRLKRRRAFSRGSPSCTRTSAKIDTPPNLPSAGDLQDITPESQSHINLWENFFKSHKCQPQKAKFTRNCSRNGTFQPPSYTQAMLRPYQGIRPT